jgi:hypothetical protein
MKNPIRGIPSALSLICLPFLITITAQSPSPYTIAGDLHDDGGQLFSGATVCALQTNGKIVNVRDKVCAESDAQGKFVINLASSGRYQVVAEKMSEGYARTHQVVKGSQSGRFRIHEATDSPGAG